MKFEVFSFLERRIIKQKAIAIKINFADLWRRAGERHNIENIVPSVKHGGGGIMVWGCFSGRGMGPLVRVDGKINHQDYIRILDENLLPLMQSDFNGKGYAFQDDNAPVHIAKGVANWIEERKIKILPNPIEQLWDELERRYIIITLLKRIPI